MARFISQRIVNPETGQIYEIELSIDRLAALRNSLSVEIVARRRSSDDAAGQEISATVTLDMEGHRLMLEMEGEEVGAIPLDGNLVSEADLDEVPDAAEGFTGRAWAAVRDNLLSDDGTPAGTVEEIIQALPVFDPVLGCLLKGGISATAGQIIRCYEEADFVDQMTQRLRLTAYCLGRNAWGVLARASWRAARCMATLGLG
jgi:hypothetical protein